MKIFPVNTAHLINDQSHNWKFHLKKVFPKYIRNTVWQHFPSLVNLEKLLAASTSKHCHRVIANFQGVDIAETKTPVLIRSPTIAIIKSEVKFEMLWVPTDFFNASFGIETLHKYPESCNLSKFLKKTE